MKAKRKKSDPFSVPTPIIGCFFLGTVIGIIGFCLVITFVAAPSAIKTYTKRPLIRNAVVEQCNIPDYRASGYLDESTFDFYYDSDYLGHTAISCSRISNTNSWECTCENIESP